MALELGSAVVAVRVDNSQLNTGLKQAQRTATTRFARIAASAKAAAASIKVAWSAVRFHILAGVAVLGVAVVAAARQAKAEAKLQAVLKATGGVAGQSRAALLAYATAMSHLTESGDEAIINAQAMMLTFKNIQGDTFPRAMTAAMDLASALDTDLKQAVVQLGKALNDPVQGVTAMNRSGVQFTEKQRDMIKALVETNDLLGAQAIILKEVEGQLGGAAVAAGESLSGSMHRLKNATGDVLEALGKLVADGGVLDSLTNMIAGLDAAFTSLQGKFSFLARTPFFKKSGDEGAGDKDFTAFGMLQRAGKSKRQRDIAAGGVGVPGSDASLGGGDAARALQGIAESTAETARNTKENQGGLT